MRNFLNLHPGYNPTIWRESELRSQSQENHYDCGIWAIANTWAWMEGNALPVEVGLPDRLRIGRRLLDAAEVAEQARQPVPTDEVEFMGVRNMNTPLRGNVLASGSRMPTPLASRASAQRDEALISAAMQAQQLCGRTPSPMPGNPTTSKAPTSGPSLSSVRSSLLATPPPMRTSEGLIDTSRRTPSISTRRNTLGTLTSRGSPTPRN